MTSNEGSGTSILGSLRSADGNGVVRIEDRYHTDIDDLWSALTDPGRLARWYGQVEGDLRPGGEFRLESWRKGRGAPPFDETIEATLTADGDRIVLVIEVQGLPLDKIAFYGAGWQIHAENLAAHIAGRERGDSEARWDELVPPYQELAANVR